jgi:hypothetical protein
MLPSLFHSRHLTTDTESSNVTDCGMCVILRSVMGQIVELRRPRPYGAEGITNGIKLLLLKSEGSDD